MVHNRDWQIWAEMGRYGQRWAEGCPQPRKMIQVMIACHKNQQATTRERPPWSSAVSHQVCCTTLQGPHHFFSVDVLLLADSHPISLPMLYKRG